MSNSDRLALPLLAAAQAQKEMTHNEALALAEIAIQPVVQSVAPTNVPSAPTLGQCWIVGPSPSGAWTGHAGALAGWTAGGWRFVAPFEGMSAWSLADSGVARRGPSAWALYPRQSHVASPSGGSTVDMETRAAITAMLSRLEALGLFAPS